MLAPRTTQAYVQEAATATAPTSAHRAELCPTPAVMHEMELSPTPLHLTLMRACSYFEHFRLPYWSVSLLSHHYKPACVQKVGVCLSTDLGKTRHRLVRSGTHR